MIERAICSQVAKVEKKQQRLARQKDGVLNESFDINCSLVSHPITAAYHVFYTIITSHGSVEEVEVA